MKFYKALLLLALLLQSTVFAAEKILNIYAWTGEVPDFVVREFEKETGIKINISTYDNNEIMYAKLRTTKNPGYDVIMPSSNFVDRMQRQGMLEKLDKSKLTNWNNLNPSFLHRNYDPNNEFSVPYIWGITGIFVNDKYFSPYTIKKWKDLWDKRFENQLMVLDDSKELFSIALLTLGHPVNDQNPEHIKEAYLLLKSLMKNIKVFSTSAVVAIIMDEDAKAGIAWNGDTMKARSENAHINFIIPEDGFIIWVDSFAVPKSAPHKNAAYLFLDFMMRPDIAKRIVLYTNYATANLAAQKILPPDISENPIIYPSKEVLSRGQFQTDLSDSTLALYEKYWESLKMGG
jgi:spermidine/putrescine transport system substrate-binding protein